MKLHFSKASFGQDNIWAYDRRTNMAINILKNKDIFTLYSAPKIVRIMKFEACKEKQRHLQN
jgi:hypothetical protein